MNAEIDAVKAATRKRIAAIRERDAKVQQRVDLRIVALLRRQHPEAAAKLEAAARAAIVAESAERSEVATAAAAKRAGAAEPAAASSRHGDSDADRYDHEHEHRSES